MATRANYQISVEVLKYFKHVHESSSLEWKNLEKISEDIYLKIGDNGKAL